MSLQGPFWNLQVSMLQEDWDLDGWVEGLEAGWEGVINGGGPSWRKQKMPPTSPKSPLPGSTLTSHHAREESCLLASVSGSAQSQHGCIRAEAEEE